MSEKKKWFAFPAVVIFAILSVNKAWIDLATRLVRKLEAALAELGGES